jgi:hypothetical protein
MSVELHAAAAVLPMYLLDRRLGGPQSRSERYGIEKNLLQLGFEPWPSSQPIAVPTELRWLVIIVKLI